MDAPQKQTAGGNRPFATNQNTDTRESTADDKAETALIAKMALAGHVVHRGQRGGFLVTRWSLSRYCKDFAELQEMAARLGVSA